MVCCERLTVFADTFVAVVMRLIEAAKLQKIALCQKTAFPRAGKRRFRCCYIWRESDQVDFGTTVLHVVAVVVRRAFAMVCHF